MRQVDADIAISLIQKDKIEGKPLDIIKALGDGLQAETLNMACDRHIKIINSLPTIEAEPRKHGRWVYVKTIINGEKEYKCSECNAPLYCYGTPKQAHYEWCYSCGAKMDLDEAKE